jgi:predicted transcriptional regulator
MLAQNIRKRRMELGLTPSELVEKIKVLDKNPSVSNDGLVVKFKPALEQAQRPTPPRV